MGLNIKLDLKNVYRVTLRDAEQRVCEFDTTLSAGEKMRLGVKISLETHPLVGKTYNWPSGL